jgi:alpha-beta hydrolase superfamily lysophospholipase
MPHGLVARLAAIGLVTCLALLAVAAPAASGTSTPPPQGLPAWYAEPKPLPKGPPGTLIKEQKVAVPGIDGTVYRVMYLSTNVHGRSVPVTGLVVVPHTPPPAGGYPVVSWGHGTNGMAPQCAPSLHPASAVPFVDQLLKQGWEVTASDYQGEGTPGPLPYLVGKDAARDTIDIVEAARHLRAAHASTDYVVWGHSEGGQTAMFALHIGTTWSEGLHLEGVVAGAPPSQFELVYNFLLTSPYRYYLYMAAAGFHAAYGSRAAPLRKVLTPFAIGLLPILSMGCASYLARQVDKYSLSQFVKTNPFSVPKWAALMKKNDPGDFTSASPVPLLIIQGGHDEQIPVASTQLLAQHLCTVGQTLQRWVYPGRSHSGVIQVSLHDMIHWIKDRFADEPVPDPYRPVGEPGVQTTSC